MKMSRLWNMPQRCAPSLLCLLPSRPDSVTYFKCTHACTDQASRPYADVQKYCAHKFMLSHTSIRAEKEAKYERDIISLSAHTEYLLCAHKSFQTSNFTFQTSYSRTRTPCEPGALWVCLCSSVPAVCTTTACLCLQSSSLHVPYDCSVCMAHRMASLHGTPGVCAHTSLVASVFGAEPENMRERRWRLPVSTPPQSEGACVIGACVRHVCVPTLSIA